MLVLGAAILFNVMTLDAGEQVRVRVSPQNPFAPADLIIYITVEPHAENRLLRVTADSSEFFRASEVALDGESSARVTILNFRELPSGEYNVTADVIGANGRRRGVAYCGVRVL